MDLATLPLVLAFVAIVASGAAAVVTFLGRPNQLRRDTAALADDVAAVERQLNLAASERVEYMKAVESIHETVREDLDRAETKRKQAAARSSKANAAPAEIDWTDPAQLRAVARDRGLL